MTTTKRPKPQPLPITGRPEPLIIWLRPDHNPTPPPSPSPPPELKRPFAWRRKPKTKRPIFNRKTTSTCLRLAVGHAFTGDYAQRFLPSLDPTYHYCPCGNGTLRTQSHVLHHCPNFDGPRHNSGLGRHSRRSRTNHYYSNRQNAIVLLDFLQSSQALSQPEQGALPDQHHVDPG